jgi:tryptophanyl-tRNA synthetase
MTKSRFNLLRVVALFSMAGTSLFTLISQVDTPYEFRNPILEKKPPRPHAAPMRILTGLQPSGKLHIGNFFGAMEPAIRLQSQGDAYYFIANYHAMTSLHDGPALLANTHELAVDFLACGLDPGKAVFFRQSDVPEVNELAWILSTVCPMGLLERCHSFKDKVAKGIAANHALFAYPVLMAADILLYDSNLVPVGKDQKQHLEVTRDLAVKINEALGEGTLTVPDALIRDDTAVVPGIDGQKMSKSYGNTIPLFGEEKQLRKLMMKIVSDSTPVEDPKPTENSTILGLYKLFASEADYQTMVQSFEQGGAGYGSYKTQLWESYWNYFAPMRQRREEILADPGYVDEVLNQGALRARETASKVLTRIRKATGLSR